MRAASRFARRAVMSGLMFALCSAHASTPLGLWINEKQTVAVRVAPCETRLCGRIVWLAKPFRKDGTLKRDEGRPLCGLVVMQDFASVQGGAWLEGTIYDPASRSTYSGRMRLTDADTLEVRGYALVSVLGRTVLWRRVTDVPDTCPVARLHSARGLA